MVGRFCVLTVETRSRIESVSSLPLGWAKERRTPRASRSQSAHSSVEGSGAIRMERSGAQRKVDVEMAGSE